MPNSKFGKRSGTRWEGKGKVLTLGDTRRPGDVGTSELGRLWRIPVEAPGSIAENAEVAIIRYAQVVETEGRANAGLARGSPQAAGRRVGDTKARSKVAPPGGRDGAWNSRITRNQVARGRVGKLDGLYSRNRSGQTAIDIAPGPGDIPAEAGINGEIGSRLPGILDEEPAVTGTVVEQLDGALDEGGRSADKVSQRHRPLSRRR